MKEGSNKNQENQEQEDHGAYKDALKDFISMTIKDSSFFKLTREEQKNVASGYIQKQKERSLTQEDNKNEEPG